MQQQKQVWKAAGLGCVAHEIGSLPMSDDPEHGVVCPYLLLLSLLTISTSFRYFFILFYLLYLKVDANLKFHKFQNLYACDMSVLPVSAPANPSLTLAALALRLADHITNNGTLSILSIHPLPVVFFSFAFSPPLLFYLLLLRLVSRFLPSLPPSLLLSFEF